MIDGRTQPEAVRATRSDHVIEQPRLEGLQRLLLGRPENPTPDEGGIGMCPPAVDLPPGNFGGLKGVFGLTPAGRKSTLRAYFSQTP